MNNRLHILFCASQEFISGTLVSMGSTIDSAAPGLELHVHIFDLGLSKESLRLIKAFIADHPNVVLSFHYPDLRRVEILARKSKWSSAVFARLLVGTEIDADSLLLIDSDILVLRDVSFFRDRAFNGALIHAAIDTNIDSLAEDILPLLPPLKPEDLARRIFNCGFVWLNLDHWRAIGAEEECLVKAPPFIQDLKFGDQTLLNSLFYNVWHPLDASWNRSKWSPVTPEINLHYLARPKPWADPLRSPEALLWWDYYLARVRPLLGITSALPCTRVRLLCAIVCHKIITPLRLVAVVTFCRVNLLRKRLMKRPACEEVAMCDVLARYVNAFQQHCALLSFRKVLRRRWKACALSRRTEMNKELQAWGVS